MRRLFLALPPAAILAALAVAAPVRADPGYDQCVDAATSNADFSACGAAMLDRREAELNQVWKQAVADLDAPTKAALLDEQRAWIAFKDKSCGFWSTGAFGREGQVIHFYVCRELVLEQRINFLNSLGEP